MARSRFVAALAAFGAAYRAPEPIPETAETGKFKEAAGTMIDQDDPAWRPLTSDTQRDLAPMKQGRMQSMAVYLWESNLLANRLIELPIAYLLAQGVKLTVADEANQKTLDRFWSDPINEMDLKLPKKVRELSLYGEQCYPAFVNEGDGHVRIGYIDPSIIEVVVMDPDNAEQPIGLITRRDKKGQVSKYRVIINGPEDVFTDRTQGIRETFINGEAFFFKINDLSNGQRGRSDLLAQIDWLDAYDQFLFGELDRAKFLRTFLWDVTLTGATQEECEARAAKMSAPAPNSMRVHNEAEVWATQTPDLKAADSAEHARLFRNHVLGGATMPEMWYGGGGDVNRSTADAMGGPTFKMYSMRQQTIKFMLEMMGRYALRRAMRGEAEPDFGDKRFQVHAEFPEMISKDLSRFTAALAQAAVGVAAMVTQGFIQKVTGVRMLAVLAAEIGIEFDADAEVTAAQLEIDKLRAKDAAIPPLPGTEDPAADPAATADNAAAQTGAA